MFIVRYSIFQEREKEIKIESYLLIELYELKKCDQIKCYYFIKKIENKTDIHSYSLVCHHNTILRISTNSIGIQHYLQIW